MNKFFCLELLVVFILILATLSKNMAVQKRDVRNDYYERPYKKFVYDKPTKVVHKSVSQEKNILDEIINDSFNQKAKQAALWKKKRLQKRDPIQCLINIIACW